MIQWPTPGSTPEEIGQIVNAVRNQLSDSFQPLTDMAAVLQAELQRISDEAESVAARVRDLVGEASGQLSANLDDAESALQTTIQALQAQVAGEQARMTDLRATIDEQRPRLDQAIAQFQEQFSAAQSERAAETSVLRKKLEDDVALISLNLQNRATERINSIEESLTEARNLVGVIAVTGTATVYGNEANNQRTEANTWRWMAIIVGVLAGLFSALTLIYAPGKSASEVTLRALGALAILGVAGYAANQSSGHRSREVRARRLELTLTAFAPFIQDLPPERQAEARERLVATAFTSPEVEEIEKAALTDDTIPYWPRWQRSSKILVANGKPGRLMSLERGGRRSRHRLRSAPSTVERGGWRRPPLWMSVARSPRTSSHRNERRGATIFLWRAESSFI